MTVRRQEHPLSERANERLEVGLFPHAPAWMIDARCAQVDFEIFFPSKGGSTRDAKSVCARCPVTTECLEYALDFESGATGTPTSYVSIGIYGGLSPSERRAIVRERRAAQ